jgi:hypothetical protein
VGGILNDWLSELMGSRTIKVQLRDQHQAETAREAHRAPSAEGPAPTSPAIDLVGNIVPDLASALDGHVGRRNRSEGPAAAADRRRRRSHACHVAGAFLVSLGLGWVGGWNSSSLFDFFNIWNPAPRDDVACLADERSSTELAQARAYLVQTASPSHTMAQQGPKLAIERLHPEFAIRLAKVLREARESGLSSAGIYSAYRPPAFGVGGFSDKFNSLHAYGLAVDLYGIGRPGSDEAQRWHEIAVRYGVICPYGPHHKREWNHCQPTGIKIVLPENLLRDTITADGPVSLETMFEAGNSVVARLSNDNSRTVQVAALATQASRIADGTGNSNPVGRSVSGSHSLSQCCRHCGSSQAGQCGRRC